MMAVLLAGSGLRRGEFLAVKVEDFSADWRVLQIKRSVHNRKEQLPKTSAAIRPVDLAPELAEVLPSIRRANLVCYSLPGKGDR